MIFRSTSKQFSEEQPNLNNNRFVPHFFSDFLTTESYAVSAKNIFIKHKINESEKLSAQHSKPGHTMFYLCYILRFFYLTKLLNAVLSIAKAQIKLSLSTP
jgi:hypothetical protein